MAGIISKTELRKDKKGNDYATFTIDDYDGSMEFRVFNSDYKRLQNYLQKPGDIVMLQLRGKTNYRNPKETETEILDIFLLADAQIKLTKSVTLSLIIDDLKPGDTEAIQKIIRKYQGKIRMKIEMETTDESLKGITMSSNKYTVSASNELYKELCELGNMKVRLN